MSSSPSWLDDLASIDAAAAHELVETFAAYQVVGAGTQVSFRALQEAAAAIAQGAQGQGALTAENAQAEYPAWQAKAQKWREESAQVASAQHEFFTRLPAALEALGALQRKIDTETAALSGGGQIEGGDLLRRLRQLERAEGVVQTLQGTWQADYDSQLPLQQAAEGARQQQQMTLMRTEIALTSALSKAPRLSPSPRAHFAGLHAFPGKGGARWASSAQGPVFVGAVDFSPARCSKAPAGRVLH